MISFDNVSFSYDEKEYVLKDFNLTIPEGQFVCILGANGSGKSTLAKLINALLFPVKGTVSTAGYPTTIVKNGKSLANEDNLIFIRKNAAMVFQNPDDQIISSIVEEEVAFGPESLGIKNPELRQRVDSALERVDMQAFSKKNVTALSGGQKQRIAIAGVLAMEPKILIFDEPSSMLDPQGQKEFMELCSDLHIQGYTIVLTSHFIEEAVLSDRVVVLKNGQIIQDGTPEHVLVQKDILEDLSLAAPFSTELSLLLQEKGMPISTQIRKEALEKELLELF